MKTRVSCPACKGSGRWRTCALRSHSPNINQCGIGFDQLDPPGQHADHTGTPQGSRFRDFEQLFKSVSYASVVVDAAARDVFCAASSPLALRGGQMLFALHPPCNAPAGRSASQMAKAKASAASAGVGILVRFKIRAHHTLHLNLLRLPVTGDSQLGFGRRMQRHGNIALRGGEHGEAGGLCGTEYGVAVGLGEHTLDRYRVRRESVHFLGQAVVDGQ